MDLEAGRVEDLERQVETLGVAMQHRTTIGVALGIIMERLDLEQEAAFAYLSRCSQEHNVKLYDLALRLVETRNLPSGIPAGPAQQPIGTHPLTVGLGSTHVQA